MKSIKDALKVLTAALLLTTLLLPALIACSGPDPTKTRPATQAPQVVNTPEIAAVQTDPGTPPTGQTPATELPTAVPITTPIPPAVTVVQLAPDPTARPQATAEPAPTEAPAAEPGTYIENSHLSEEERKRLLNSDSLPHAGSTSPEDSFGTDPPPPWVESKGDLTEGRHESVASGGVAHPERPPIHHDGRRIGQPTAPQAGEINDNEEWNQYLDYLDYHADYDRSDVTRTPLRERYVISVTDQDNRPVAGATIVVEELNGTDYRIHADGRALHHHDVSDQPIRENIKNTLVFTAINGDLTAHTKVTREPNGTHVKITLPSSQRSQGPTELDVLFLLDSTGSMSDEISKIKQTLTSIANRVVELPGNPDLRMGMVSYRDQGDRYINRLYDLDSPQRAGSPSRGRRRLSRGPPCGHHQTHLAPELSQAGLPDSRRSAPGLRQPTPLHDRTGRSPGRRHQNLRRRLQWAG